MKIITTAIILLTATIALASAIPAGTKIAIRMGSELSSATAQPGQTWKGVVAKDVVVNGNTVARTGDEVTGKVTEAKSSRKTHAPGQLRLRLTSINGEAVSSSAYFLTGKGQAQSSAQSEVIIPAESLITFTITGGTSRHKRR